VGELFQAERTAMEAQLGKRPTSGDLRADYERLAWAWIGGRGYGRERERTLEAALDFLTDTEGLDISQATVAKFAHAALASPGEPEGATTHGRYLTKPGSHPDERNWQVYDRFGSCVFVGNADECDRWVQDAEAPSELERRLRFSLEKYGEHQGDCPATGRLVDARCTCGYHAALQANPVGESNG
jgi:hypothetical protein